METALSFLFLHLFLLVKSALKTPAMWERREDDKAYQSASWREETSCCHDEAENDNDSEAKAAQYEMCVIVGWKTCRGISFGLSVYTNVIG